MLFNFNIMKQKSFKIGIVLASLLFIRFTTLVSPSNMDEIERRIIVKLESVFPIVNDQVGSDWDHYLSVGGQVLKKGEKLVLTLKKRAPLKIEAYSIEEDKDYSDTGNNSIEFPYNDLIAIDKNRFELVVDVIENSGQYVGNLARWKFIFQIERVIKG